jgi:adenylate cyclase class 2
MAFEVEIKLALPARVDQVRRALRKLGFRVSKARTFEHNVLFDTADLALRNARKLIRVRTVSRKTILTYKGPPQDGKHKKREEIELELSDGRRFGQILPALGYGPVFRYEKYRAEYQRASETGHVMLDETPIGNFLELEGPARWIDRTAKELGFEPGQAVTKSYGSLYLEYCARNGVAPSDMVFSGRKTLSR